MTDAEVVALVLAGDRSRFQVLVDRHRGLVFRAALAVLGHAADADDVLQDTFLAAYQGLKELKDRDNVRGWLYAIAWHTAHDVLRRRIRARAVERSLEQAAEPVAPPDPAPGVQDVKQRIREGLDQLPEPLRQVILLKYVDGLSYRDISRTLDISEGAVGERLYRARKQFEQVLTARGSAPGN